MKKVLLLVFVLVLASTAMIGRFVRPVEAGGTIYIRADGSIGGTTDIMTVDNVTYTFTANINDSIVVERDNIIIDGAGYTLQGTVANFSKGIDLSNRNNVAIKNMKIKTFFFGIYLELSSNNTLFGNTIVGNQYGMFLYSSSNFNTIHGNNITNYFGVWTGIGLSSSSNNTISGNYIKYNEYGITIYDSSDHNTISGNNITDSIRGINLYESSNNKFYHNNFLDNIKHVYIYPYVHANFWDNGVEGNYWSNYAGDDSDNNGVGDSVRPIDGNNTDHYPLMGMFHSFNTTLGKHVNVISNSTVDSFRYFESNSTIIMHVSNMTANQTHGFCRVSIPYEVMSEPSNVTIDGAYPTYWNYTLYDNGTHRWIYFEYEHTTREIVIIPEFPTWTSMLLIFMMLSVAIAIYQRRLPKTPIH